jgi:hypothetical protein
LKTRIVFLVLLLGIVSAPSLYGASPDKGVYLERKIFEKILRAVMPYRQRINLYFYGSSLPEGLRNHPTIRWVRSPNEAKILIISSRRFSPELAKLHVPVLTLDYNLLKRYPNAIGAYFWQKGRPNIIMIRSRLEKAGIRLPREFDRFTDDTIW